MSAPRRVLVLRAGALGDLLLLRPALATLRAAGANIGLVAPPAGALLGPSGLREVEEWTAWDDPRLLPLHYGGVLDEAFAEHLVACDAAIAYTGSADLIASLGRVVNDVHAFDPTRLPRGVHASLSLAQPALDLVGGALREPPVPAVHPADALLLQELLARLPLRFLALHPGSGAARKNWPAERFAALADRLAPRSPYLVVEGPADAAAVAQARKPRAVVARGLPLRALGALLAGSALYVGNDSGVSHLAAAFGAPTLALFGPTDATVWAPRGPSALTLSAHDGSLEALEVDAVVTAAEGALTSWGRPGPPFD